MSTKKQDPFQNCLKCETCNQVCPVLEVDSTFPGPKQAGPDRARRARYDHNPIAGIDKCLGCRRCELACPSGIPVAKLVSEGKTASHRARSLLLSSTDQVGALASTVAPLANWALGLGITKKSLDLSLGIDSHRQMPRYERQRFSSWFATDAPDQSIFTEHVHFFHGCYVEYNNPQLGRDLVKVLNALGIGVRLLSEERCCGVAKLANCRKEAVIPDARINVEAIREAGGTVVACSPTCVLTIRNDYPAIIGDGITSATDKLTLAQRLIARDDLLHRIKALTATEGPEITIAYHEPCHLKRLGWGIYTRLLLEAMPMVKVVDLPSRCCGMAGTYGFKKENREASLAIGEPLFTAARASGASLIVTDCETCKWQLEMGTGMEVLHPVSLLARYIDIHNQQIPHTPGQ